MPEVNCPVWLEAAGTDTPTPAIVLAVRAKLEIRSMPFTASLSNPVRAHRKLRAAGVEAVLQVWEGQSHAQYLRDISAPETKEYYSEVTRFFDAHLGR